MSQKDTRNLVKRFLYKKESNGTYTLRTRAVLFLISALVCVGVVARLATRKKLEPPPTLIETSIEDVRAHSKFLDETEKQQEKAKSLYEELSQKQGGNPLSAYLESATSPLHDSGAQSMLIKREGESSSVETTLPRGTLLVATLLNTIVSNNAKSPVVAKVLIPHNHLGQLLIPEGTKLIGQGAQDNNPKRVMVTFDTMVFPSKKQVSFSATALNPDGSSGLTGQYYSGKGKQIFGALLSSAIAGAAQGFQGSSISPFGAVVTQGSARNAAFGAASGAALEQARLFAREIETAQSFVVVPQEAEILIFFDQALDLEDIAYEY